MPSDLFQFTGDRWRGPDWPLGPRAALLSVSSHQILTDLSQLTGERCKLLASVANLFQVNFLASRLLCYFTALLASMN